MKLKERRGSEIVEFALVLPVLLFVVFGIVDFGLAIFNKAIVTNAAREAARAGIVFAPTRPDETAIAQVARDYCLQNMVTFGDENTPAVTVNGEGGSSGSELEVIVTYRYGWLVMPGFLPLGTDIEIRARSVMRME